MGREGLFGGWWVLNDHQSRQFWLGWWRDRDILVGPGSPGVIGWRES